MILTNYNTEMTTKLAKGTYMTDDHLLYGMGYHLGLTLMEVQITGQQPNATLPIIIGACLIVLALIVGVGRMLYKRNNTKEAPFASNVDQERLAVNTE